MSCRAQGQLATTVSHMREGAQQVLDSFCGLYTREPRQVTWHAHSHLGGHMLVEAAFVALPHSNGVEVGSLLLALLTLFTACCFAGTTTVCSQSVLWADPLQAVCKLSG